MGSHVALVARDATHRKALADAFLTSPPGWDVTLHESPPATADVIVSDVPLADAVVFDPRQPDAASNEVARRLAASALTFIVTGASGGTGATTVALQLAAEFARSGRSTCFVDLDLEWGVSTRLGLETEVVRWSPGGKVPAPASSVPLPGGFRALLPPSDLDGAGTRAMVGSARASFDRVVIDAPRSVLRDVLDLARGALLVMSPTPTGALRARNLLERFPDCRWAVLANRLGRGGETTATTLSQILGRRIGVELPCCPQVRDAEDLHALPSGRWTRWERRVAQLAVALERS